MSSIVNKPALIRVIAWRRNNDKPLLGQAITWTNDDPVRWRKYAALGGNELTASLRWWICTGQATIHDLNQWRPHSMALTSITPPQWVVGCCRFLLVRHLSQVSCIRWNRQCHRKSVWGPQQFKEHMWQLPELRLSYNATSVAWSILKSTSS